MKKITIFILIVSIVVLLLQSCKTRNGSNEGMEEIILADASVVWWMAPGLIAQKDSLYKQNGLRVKSFDVQTGLASKNAVLSRSADVGLVASTPLALGAFSHENLIVLCSYVQSDHLLSLITSNHTDTAAFALPQTPVAIVKGTISEIYFYNYLSKYYPNEKDRIIKDQLNVKPPDVGNAMKSGNAKSAVIWEPFGTMIASSNSSFKQNRSPDIYTHRIYIITTPEILKRKGAAIDKFVKSFSQASELIKSNPDKAKGMLKEAFPQQEASMNALWDKVDFSVKTDYEQMKGLIMQDAQISYELGQTPKDNSGNPRQLTSDEISYYFNHDFKIKY